MSAEAQRPLGKRLLTALPLIVIVMLATLFLEGAGWLRGFETHTLDAGLRLMARHHASEDIYIVRISDADYDFLFHRQSPLDGRALYDLLAAIAAGRPAVIGVDLDTADVSLPSNWGSPPRWPPIVWARAAGGEGEEIEAFGVLGGSNPGLLSGLSLLPRDPDGIVRRYRRRFRVGGEELDAFPWAVARAYCGLAEHRTDLTCRNRAKSAPGDWLLNVFAERYEFEHLNAAHVMQASQGPDWATEGPLHGKIVLVGGCYKAARDEYITPFGPMAGVALMAQALQSDLRGSAIPPGSLPIILLVDVVGGLTLVLLHEWRPVGIGWTLLAVPVIALLSSFFAYHSLAYWATFAPVLVGVFLHEFHHHLSEHRALRARLASLERDP